MGLAGLAIVDWHVTLQFIGCTAVLFSLANRVTSYNSPQVQPSPVYMTLLPSSPDAHGSEAA